jgi:hypothetical protein
MAELDAMNKLTVIGRMAVFGGVLWQGLLSSLWESSKTNVEARLIASFIHD